MKLGRAVASVALGLVMSSAAFGADVFWDTNGAGTGGGGTTAPGTWGVDSFWTSDSAGLTAPTSAWVAGNNAIFSAGTNVTGAYTVTVDGTQSVGTITFEEGRLTLAGGELALVGGAITNNTNNNQTISSIISGSAGLTKAGTGSVTLTNANTYSGGTTINTGRLIITNGNALGSGDITFPAGSTTTAYTGQLFIQGGITVANNITITSGNRSSTAGPGQLESVSGDNVWTGNITLSVAGNNIDNGIGMIGVSSGTLTHTGTILAGSPVSAFTKVGAGTLILGGDNPNTHTGLTRVFGGTLIAQKNGAFGAPTGGVFMVSNSGSAAVGFSSYMYQTIGLQAPPSSPDGFDYSTAENGNNGMSLAGISNDLREEGLLHNFSGKNSYAGNILLGNVTQTYTVPTQIGAATNSSLTLNGNVTNPVANPPNLSLRNLTKIGGGSLILTGGNTHIGSVIVANGLLSYRSTVAGGTTGTWTPSGPAASFAEVGPNGTLRFDNTDAVNVNRFVANASGAPMPVNVDGGKFELVGNATADTFQGVIGAGLNAIGDASFTVTNPSSSLPETDPRFTTSLGIAPIDPNPVVGGINRGLRGTMLLRGTGLGTAATGVSQIFLDSALNAPVGEAGGTGTKVGILPFATGDASGTASGPTGFVTYGPNGVRHLDEATEYAVGITSGSTDLVNATMNTPQAVLVDTAVNSARMTTGGNTIVVSDLASLSVNSGAILNPSSDAVSIRNGVLNFGGAEGVITTVGDMNITSMIMGSNGVTKSGRGNLTLAADNQFSGPLTLNGGNLIFSADTQLGPAPASPTVGALVLNGGSLKPQGSITLSSNRGITLGSQYAGVDVAAGETLTIGSSIDGAGNINKKGAGTLVLSGSNTFTGGMKLDEGVVSITDDSQLGSPSVGGTSGILTFNGGTLRINGSTTINTNRGVYITSRNATVEVADGQTVNAPWYANGPGSLIKTGKGTLVLGGAIATSAYLGTNFINEGTLAYAATTGLNVDPSVLFPNYWTISNGATLQMLLTSTGTTLFGVATRGITLVNAGNIDIAGTNVWALNAPITGTGTLTKTGSGELRLAVANTYNGKTTVTGGLLSLGVDSRLGTVINAADAITLDGGALGATASFTLNANRGIKLGANNGTLRAGSGFTLTYGGVISGTGNLTKGDVGTVALTGTSTYTGTTTVEAGILRVNGSLTGGGDLTVNPGATLQGTGSILSNVIVASGGHVAPGSSVGTLTMNALALDTSILDIEGNTSGFDRINVTLPDKFTLANNSTINVSDLGGAQGGAEYVIIDYAGTPLADLSGLSLSSPTLGTLAISLINDQANTQVKLRVAAAPPPQWNVDADGSWGNDNNWNTFVQPNGPSDAANFLGKITAARTVTLDGAKTVNQVNFNNPNTYTLAPGAGGSLTVTGGSASISVSAGNHVISAPVTLTDDTAISVTGAANGLRLDGGLSIAAGKTLTKKADGTLTINGAQTHGAGAVLQVAQGKVNLVSNAGTAATAATAAGANLSLSIFNGGGASSIVLGSHQDFKEATVTYTDSDLQGLDLNSPAAPGAYNALRIYASDVDATKVAMASAIHNATITAGDGVYDSGIAAHPGSAIGVAVVSDAHGDKLTMVRPTRVGDLNLDGAVTISDFIDLASNFNASGPGITWQEGDLNGDQAVTISDFIDLAANFNGSYSGSIGAVSASDLKSLAGFASSLGVDPAVIGSAVPEPGSLGLLSIGALGLMARRRRR